MGERSALEANSASSWWQMVADSRNTVQKPAARRSRRLLWCSPTKTRRRQPARWPSLAPSPASQPYQPLTTPKTGAQSVAHFAKPVRIPRRERAENPKTTRKTARRTVKTLNKGPNFRMFDTYGTPFLFDWPSCTPAWHYPGGSPHLVRKPRHCSRNHARRPLASARLRSGTPPTRWSAADSAPLAHRERSTGKQRDD